MVNHMDFIGTLRQASFACLSTDTSLLELTQLVSRLILSSLSASWTDPTKRHYREALCADKAFTILGQGRDSLIWGLMSLARISNAGLCDRYARFGLVPGESWKPEYQCLFVANAYSDNVSGLSIDPQTGALTALTG